MTWQRLAPKKKEGRTAAKPAYTVGPMRALAVLSILLLGGCELVLGITHATTGDAAIDGPLGPDSAVVDAPPGTDGGQPGMDGGMGPDGGGGVDAEADSGMPPAPDTHILLTEVTLAGDGAEFIEIYNPTSAEIDLTNYYLADNNNYARLPHPTSIVGENDFIARFPAGAKLMPREVAVVCMSTPGAFAASFPAAAPPRFSVAGGSSQQHMIHIAGPANANLSNNGEMVALFYWDGAADLIQDVDLMNAGEPTNTNLLEVKTGLRVDGPDGDMVESEYAYDSGRMTIQVEHPTQGKSTKRIHGEAAYELQDPRVYANGLHNDHDETSEQIGLSWDAVFTAPTPGQIPAGL